MNALTRVIIACALCLPTPALAMPAEPPSACATDPGALGILGRMGNLRAYIERIERSVDPLEQRRLMAIHLKVMGEGMRELRKHEAGEPCRVEMLHAMMEQMLRHQIAEQEVRER